VLNLFALWTAGASWKKWLMAQTLLAAAVLPWLWVRVAPRG
jgi:hypothetical protein